MAGTTRTIAEIEAGRTLIAEMVLTGHQHSEIAEKLGVSRQQITYDWGVIKTRWRERTTMDLTDAKAQEVAKIDKLEQVYWDAWAITSDDKVFQTKEGALLTLAQIGDPQLLAGILKCIDRRCKLLGLDAPIQIDGEFRSWTFTFDTPNGPRSPEELEALGAAGPIHTNGVVIDV